MIKFNVKISGTDKGKQEVIDKCKLVLMKSMFKMEELAIDYAPVDRGDLVKNISVFPGVLSGHYVLTSYMPYSEALEFGNTPAQVKFEDIEKWVQRKGIRTGKNVYPFTKYVVEKIRTKGVNRQSFMRPALNITREFWMPQFKREVFNQ